MKICTGQIEATMVQMLAIAPTEALAGRANRAPKSEQSLGLPDRLQKSARDKSYTLKQVSLEIIRADELLSS